MSWIWVGIGGALVLGFYLGVTLMGLLVMSRDSRSADGLAVSAPPGPEGKCMLNGGRPVVAAGSAVRGGGFPETFSLKDPIPANDAWEEFDARTGGVC